MNILHEIRKRKANWIGHILRRNCLLQRVIEGKIKGSKSALHVSGDVFAHHQEHLTVFTVASNQCSPKLLPAGQPTATWGNITRYCKYSQVLLMMGENIARNM